MSNPLDRTAWFPPTVKPVRDGWYECRICVNKEEGKRGHYWNGRKWTEDPTKYQFYDFTPFMWRGLARKV